MVSLLQNPIQIIQSEDFGIHVLRNNISLVVDCIALLSLKNQYVFSLKIG